MSRRHVLGTAAVVLLILSGAAAAGRTSVQAQPPASAAERRFGQAGLREDVLPALLDEVKGLRAAMEQMAAAGPRVQLSVGRLQLQEGRIAGMIRRLDTVRDALVGARRDADRLKGAMKMFEGEAIAAHKPGDPPQEQEDAAAMLAGMKEELSRAQANVNRLTAEEQQLAGEVSVEQARWVEINQRLDELERTLAKR